MCCTLLERQQQEALTLSHPVFLQIRPYLISDGGNVALHDIDGPIVQLKLQGACGSCPSSMTTMTMGIKRRLMEKIPVSLGLRITAVLVLA